MELEKDLERLLRRERPPAGFAARVMQRIDSEGDDRRGRLAPTMRNGWWRALAAALLLAIVGGGWIAHHEQEQREGERARAQVLLALQITSAKMHAAREHVRELGTH